VAAVSARITTALAGHVTKVFGVIGNGNIHFLDAVERSELRFTAVRHEGGAVTAADAYSRVCGEIGVATTTYGPGFSNTLTGLAEAARARTPLLLVTGDAPTTGPRPWDIAQAEVAAGVGVPTYVVDTTRPAVITREALQHALQQRCPVVLAIPYDVGSAVANANEPLPNPVATPRSAQPTRQQLSRVAELLNTAHRPLFLAGRGARLADAGPAIEKLSDRLGALSATTVAARSLLRDDGHLGIAGGFGSAGAVALMGEADVVVVFGAGLNQFTTRSGTLFAPDATVVQIDVADSATNDLVELFVPADAGTFAEQIGQYLTEPTTPTWRVRAAERLRHVTDREQGDSLAPDGRLDPRSLAIELNNILPASRVVVQDGGHFIGWAPMYWDIPGPHALHTVGTAYQAIGTGLSSAVGAGRARPRDTVVLTTGDGGMLMALADLDSVVRTVASGIVVVFNDAAYGAEIHQHGADGPAHSAMTIPEVDFAGVAAALGATTTRAHTLDDLDKLRDWVDNGASGVFVLDCRVSPQIAAPYIVAHAS